MKKLILLSLLAIYFLSCENLQKTTILAGHIENPKVSSVSISLPDSTHTTELDSLGNFVLNFSTDTVVFATFSHGNEKSSLFLQPGDSLELSLNANEFDETLSFSGKGSANNNYLASLFLLNENLPKAWQLFNSPKNVDDIMQEYQNETDSVYQVRDTHLDKWQGKIDSRLFDYQKSINFYQYAQTLQQGAITAGYRTDSLNLPDGYYDYEAEISLNESSLIDNPQYSDLVQDYIMYRAYKGEKIISMDQFNEALPTFFRLADSLITSKTVKSEVMNSYFSFYGRYILFENLEKIFTSYKDVVNAETEQFMSEMVSGLRNIAPGNEVPDYTFYTLDSDSVKLSDYRGKIVYIDFWATWCGPCIGEQPFLEKIIEELGEDKIEFISLSTDRSKKPWIKMVNEKELTGTHLWVPGAWSADIMNFFMIKGIPHYVILDENGKIVSNNATRPSAGVKEELEKLASALES